MVLVYYMFCGKVSIGDIPFQSIPFAVLGNLLLAYAYINILANLKELVVTSAVYLLLGDVSAKVVDQWVARSWQGILPIIAASTSVGGALLGTFTELQSSNRFDKSATFVGAFRDASDDWTAGWANFDPENTIY